MPLRQRICDSFKEMKTMSEVWIKQICDLVTHWQMLDEDGKEILPTPEFVTTLSTDFLGEVVKAIRGDINLSPDQKKRLRRWLILDGNYDEPSQETLDEWRLYRAMKVTGVPMWELQGVSDYWIDRALSFSIIDNEVLEAKRSKNG